jgi:hypothetical protein
VLSRTFSVLVEAGQLFLKLRFPRHRLKSTAPGGPVQDPRELVPTGLNVLRSRRNMCIYWIGGWK